MTLLPLSFRKRYGSSYETPSSSASQASPSTFPLRKRYRGTSKQILDTEIEGDKSKAEGTGLKSEESKDEGRGSESKEAAPEGQQQQVVPIEDIAMDEPLGLGYGAARRCALELVEGPVPNIEFDTPPVLAPIQTPASPEWSFGSLPISPASLTVPSPVASPVTTPTTIIAVDEDDVSGLGAWNEVRSMPPSLSVPYGDQFWPLRPGHDRQTPREHLCGRLAGWCDSRIHHQLDPSLVTVDPWEELGQLLSFYD
ncbi:hypothetical protein Tco_1216980 [Tanacetum coccineum]